MLAMRQKQAPTQPQQQMNGILPSAQQLQALAMGLNAVAQPNTSTPAALTRPSTFINKQVRGEPSSFIHPNLALLPV